MTDARPPRVFVAVVPCRVVDTRNTPGPYGGPALATNVVRGFDIDNGPCPGLPVGIEAYSLNFGGILPPADGFLTAWPTGTSQPLVSQLNLVGGEVVANAAIVPAGAGGSIDVLVNIGPTHVYIDINGYFSDTLGNPANSFDLVNSSPNRMMRLMNQATNCIGSCGLEVVTVSTFDNFAILGEAQGTSGGNTGIVGRSWSSNIYSAGVVGFANGSSGATHGIRGQNISSSADSAGIFGTAGPSLFPLGSFQRAGVRGESPSTGVMGISPNAAVSGILVDGSGASVAQGHLGYNVGPGYGVWAASNFGGTGAKYFVEPHPTDPSKVIRYVSLEGPEAGTYFRGRGKFERGMARVPVPEDFRMVTDEEGLTVQVTPIGPMATVSVLRADLNEIVMQSSRNGEFYYLVQGVRRAFRDERPIGGGTEFMPESPDARIPGYLTEEARRRLIANGTYNGDGTVNMETARRLGWDRIWAERAGPPSPQPLPE